MKVFISSVITGYETYRETTSQAVDHIRQSLDVMIEPVRVEVNYSAIPTSSQQACMDGVRSCDVYILLLGTRYGWINPQSSLSATHEEYREAVAHRKPILAFVEDIPSSEPEQETFIKEVENYTTGVFRRRFTGAAELRLEVEHALTELLKSQVVKPAGSLGGTQFTQSVTNHGSDPVFIQNLGTLYLDRRPKS